jgi:hypothetical protein
MGGAAHAVANGQGRPSGRGEDEVAVLVVCSLTAAIGAGRDLEVKWRCGLHALNVRPESIVVN